MVRSRFTAWWMFHLFQRRLMLYAVWPVLSVHEQFAFLFRLDDDIWTSPVKTFHRSRDIDWRCLYLEFVRATELCQRYEQWILPRQSSPLPLFSWQLPLRVQFYGIPARMRIKAALSNRGIGSKCSPKVNEQIFNPPTASICSELCTSPRLTLGTGQMFAPLLIQWVGSALGSFGYYCTLKAVWTVFKLATSKWLHSMYLRFSESWGENRDFTCQTQHA